MTKEEFWQQVYLVALAGIGGRTEEARAKEIAKAADAAVEEMKSRFKEPYMVHNP